MFVLFSTYFRIIYRSQTADRNGATAQVTEQAGTAEIISSADMAMSSLNSAISGDRRSDCINSSTSEATMNMNVAVKESVILSSSIAA